MITRELPAGSALSWGIGGALIMLFLLGLFKVVAPFLEGLVWGIILVLMTWPLYHWLHVKCGLREALASISMTVGVGIVLILAVAPIVTEMGKELYAISSESNFDSQSGAGILSVPALEAVAQRLHIDDASALLFETLGGLSLGITGRMAQLFLNSLTNIGMMLFSSYFFFRYGSRLTRECRGILTRYSKLNWQRIFALTGGTIKGVVYGAVTTALAQGILAGLGFYVAAAPIPVLLGVATMLMSFVPFGAPFVYVPVSLYLVLVLGDWVAGLGLLSWSILVVSTIDNILRPLFISQTIRLPLLLVFIGVVGGIFAFGLIGLFIGPILIALAHAAWQELVDSSSGAARGRNEQITV